MNIVLPEALKAFVEAQVAEGHYTSASEDIHRAMALLNVGGQSGHSI
jgi:putative addiction module CopG family antidote